MYISRDTGLRLEPWLGLEARLELGRGDPVSGVLWGLQGGCTVGQEGGVRFRPKKLS